MASQSESQGHGGPQRIDDTTGPGAGISDTEARRVRRGREIDAKLNEALARKRCPNCGQTGCWDVASSPRPAPEESGNRTRYVKCRGCGYNDKVVIKEE